MNARSLFLSCCLAAAVAAPAYSAPTTVTADESLVFNFDFIASGATPLPLYSSVTFNSGIQPSSFSFDQDFGAWQFFDAIDATGNLLLAVSSLGLTTTSFGAEGWRDGVFLCA